MKCPKCGYLGFDEVERCRNCGYDFSLMQSAVDLPDLALRPDAPAISPLDDLTLIDAATAPPPAVPMSDAGPDLHRVTATAELPLFGPPIPDDEPLIKRASPPRPPLAVRRSTPEPPRIRTDQPRPQPLDLTLDLDAPAPRQAPSYTPLPKTIAS